MSEENALPRGWIYASLQDIAPPGGTRNPKTNHEDVFFYVDIEAVDNIAQKIAAPKQIKTSNAPSRARMAIQAGDVIFSLVRPYLKNIAIVPQELDGQVASTAYCVMRPESGVLSSFVFYAFLRESFIDSIVTYGNSPPSAHDDEFLAMTIPLAPTNEQQRIVAAIEQQFTRLDAGIAALKRAQAKLKRYRAAVLKAAVEGKLTEAWRAEHPTTEPASTLLERILKERRAKWEADLKAKGKDPTKVKYVEPAKPDMEGLPELPEGWCWATVEQLADVGTGATPLRSRSEYYLDGKIPWVTSGALNEEVVTSTEEFITEKALAETNAKIFPSGTLLLAMYGEGKTRGKVSELKIDAATNQACAAIVFRPLSKLCQQYVKYFLLSNYYNIRHLSVGGVQPNLNLSIVKETLVPLPPISEQEKIVDEVERRLSFVSNLEIIIDANHKRAERLRQSILKEAFAGRFVPQDPNDEPASVLLDHIREDRDKRKQAKQLIESETLMSIPQDMENMKTSSRQRLSLIQVLSGVQNPLTPEELFSRAGFQADDIYEFYEELRKEVVDERIEVLRPDDTQVLLKATTSISLWKI